MKILMAARRYPPDIWSGTETVFANLYKQARQRHEIRLVVGWTRDRGLVPAESVAVELRDLPRSRVWLRMSRAILSEARRWKPDVVLSNSIEVPPSGIPTACIVHDLNFGKGKAGRGLSERFKKRFYSVRSRNLGAVVTVSAASARALEAAGVDKARIHPIHNGVDIDAFSPRTREAGDDSDGVHPDRVRLAYPSRILPSKGQHFAIDAVARLNRKHKRRVHLTIAGAVADPVYLDQLRIQAYNQPVDFALDVASMPPYYQDADIVLFPTVMDEGFGFTAVEGMSCGKPVIWFDQPAVREATAGIGVPVPRGDVDALRKAITRLMDDPDERARIGAAGRQHVEAHLSWTRVWERYEAVLSSLVR